MSYLAEMKAQLEDVFIEAFERTWKDVVEPALKESYKNGVKAGAEGNEKPESDNGGKSRRRWSSRSRTSGSATAGS